MASSGLVLLNDARSVAKAVVCLEKATRSCPARPADFPKIPNVDAASRACCLDCPSAVAAESDHPSRESADFPKISFTFDWVSIKSPAAPANLYAAYAPAARPTARALPEMAADLPISFRDLSASLVFFFVFSPSPSTDFPASDIDRFQPSTTAWSRTVTVRSAAIGAGSRHRS